MPERTTVFNNRKGNCRAGLVAPYLMSNILGIALHTAEQLDSAITRPPVTCLEPASAAPIVNIKTSSSDGSSVQGQNSVSPQRTAG